MLLPGIVDVQGSSIHNEIKKKSFMPKSRNRKFQPI